MSNKKQTSSLKLFIQSFLIVSLVSIIFPTFVQWRWDWFMFRFGLVFTLTISLGIVLASQMSIKRMN
jgi:hypothetical protein